MELSLCYCFTSVYLCRLCLVIPCCLHTCWIELQYIEEINSSQITGKTICFDIVAHLFHP